MSTSQHQPQFSETPNRVVYETKEYSRFKFLPGNRGIIKPHLMRLKSSMTKRLLVSPIIVNDEYYIIDGQHRFQACVELNLPVYYIINSGYGLTEVLDYNTINRVWTYQSYLDSYADQGRRSYVVMKHFMLDFPEIPITSIIAIVSGKTGSPHQKSNKGNSFINGDFKIDDEIKAYNRLRMIEDYAPYFQDAYTIRFVSALIRIFENKNYDHQYMKRKLPRVAHLFRKCATNSQYQDLIEHIYNYRNQAKVNIANPK